MNTIVWIISRKDRNALYSIRTLPDLQIAEQENSEIIWLKANAVGDIPLKIKQLPVIHTYRLDNEGFCFPISGQTPTAKIQENMKWVSLLEAMPIELPTPAMPAVVEQKISVKLKPLLTPKESTGLLVGLEKLAIYVNEAPEIRIKHLKFAVSQEWEAFVWGTPILPVQGREYWQTEQLMFPAGFGFESSILETLFSQKKDPRKEYYILFREDGTWGKIALRNFQMLSRSAVKLTQSNFNP